MRNAMNHASNRIRAALFAAAVVLVPAATIATVAPAEAQPAGNSDAAKKARAKEFYTQGRKDYDLGDFEKAVDNFKKAYAEWDDGAFLFNIAQSYRMLGDCKNALFFYKGFLSRKKDTPDTVKREVEGHMRVLEDCVRNQEAIKSRLPDGTSSPEGLDTSGGGTGGTGGTGGGGTGGGTVGTGGGGDGSSGSSGSGGGGGSGTANGSAGTETGGGDRVADGSSGSGPEGGGEIDDPEDPDIVEVTGQPTLIAVHAAAGGAAIGAGSTEIPVQLAIAATAGYPISLGEKLVLDAGAGFSFTSVPWAAGTMEGTSSMIGVFANAGGTYAIASKISLRGDLGVGLLLLGGLQLGNPFTPPNTTAGTLGMPMVRAGVTGEYAVTGNLAVALTPIAFSFSPAHADMHEDVSSLTRIEFMIGVGYRK